MAADSENWRASGWSDHEIFHLETGRRMSFRAKLGWLEEADQMVRFLAGKRRWIDKDGGVHEPSRLLAENPSTYGKNASPASGEAPGPDHPA